MIALLLALAGGAGAVTRFTVDGLVRERWSGPFPLATVAINVTGSLLLGVLTGLVLYRNASSDLALVLGTGFCGGYTTFSSASFETVRLLERGAFRLAAANLFGTLVLALGAAALGLLAVR
jgi:CrcB protein